MTTGILTADMKRIVEEQRLGFVATVCPDGTPNLSPKGTTAVWDDDRLLFANIRSPRTIANLRQNPIAEVNVVDPFVRKGYRFKGVASVLDSGALYDQVIAFYTARAAPMSLIKEVVMIRVESAQQIDSPAYDLGMTEAEVTGRWERHFFELRTKRNVAALGAEPRDAASSLFLEFSRDKLIGQYWPRLRAAVESLTEQQVWWRPNQASNSVGNLLLHLNGNVRQWLVASFSGRDDDRNRPGEFAERRGIARDALLETLGATMKEASDVLTRLSEADLAGRIHIQGYTVTGLDAVYQVVEHFGMHYGQVLYITKLVRGADLGFYRELDKTGRAEI